MKKATVLAAFFFLFIPTAMFGQQRVGTVICGGGANQVILDLSPGGDLSDVIVKCLEDVTILSEQGGWFLIEKSDRHSGYISHYFLQLGRAQAETPQTNTSATTKVAVVQCSVDGKQVRLLSSPTGTAVRDAVDCGQKVTILGGGGDMFLVETSDGHSGYLSHYWLSFDLATIQSAGSGQDQSPGGTRQKGTTSSTSQQSAYTTSRMAEGTPVTAPIAQTKSPYRKGLPTILVDTDDDCRLTVDGDDEGIITPSNSEKLNVSIGDHVLKCVVETQPDLVWRKVVSVTSTAQVAAIISLKALQIQYDEAAGQAQQAKASAEAASEQQLAQAEAATKAAEARKRQLLDRLSQFRAEWGYDTTETISYNNGCMAAQNTHFDLSLKDVDEDRETASGTFELDSSYKDLGSPWAEGLAHMNCRTLPNGQNLFDSTLWSYTARLSCTTDDSQPCRIQMDAVSCDPNNCNTSYTSTAELQGGQLIAHFANQVIQFSRK